MKSTKKQIEKKVKSIKAVITPFDTGETWIDNKGNKYNIERAPIDWRRMQRFREVKNENKERSD